MLLPLVVLPNPTTGVLTATNHMRAQAIVTAMPAGTIQMHVDTPANFLAATVLDSMRS